MAVDVKVVGGVEMPLHGDLGGKANRGVIAVFGVGEMKVIASRVAIGALSHEERFAGGGNLRDLRVILREGIPGIRREEEIIDRVSVEAGLVGVTRAAPEVCASGVGLKGPDP